MLSGDYRFSVSDMEINWQGINDFLTLKVAGEKQVLLYQYSITSIISWVLDEFLSSSPGIVFLKSHNPL